MSSLEIESGILGPGSIPPRATKKHQNHLRVVFSFVAWQAEMPLVLDIPHLACPLKGQINYSSLRQSMSFKTTLIASMLRPIIDLEFKKLTLL